MSERTRKVDAGEQSGVFIVGRLLGASAVKYGPNHATKPGQVVPGLFEVSIDTGRRYPERATYFDTDDLGEPTTMARTIDAVKAGERCALLARPKGRDYVKGNERKVVIDYDAVRLFSVEQLVGEAAGNNVKRFKSAATA